MPGAADALPRRRSRKTCIPQFSFGGGRIANQPFFNTGQAPFTNFNTTYDVVANLTKVIGAHQAKAGLLLPEEP